MTQYSMHHQDDLHAVRHLPNISMDIPMIARHSCKIACGYRQTCGHSMQPAFMLDINSRLASSFLSFVHVEDFTALC